LAVAWHPCSSATAPDVTAAGRQILRSLLGFMREPLHYRFRVKCSVDRAFRLWAAGTWLAAQVLGGMADATLLVIALGGKVVRGVGPGTGRPRTCSRP